MTHEQWVKELTRFSLLITEGNDTRYIAQYLDQQAVLAQVDGEDEISAKLLEASGAMAKRAVAYAVLLQLIARLERGPARVKTLETGR